MDGMDGMDGWSPGGVKYRAAYAANNKEIQMSIAIYCKVPYSAKHLMVHSVPSDSDISRYVQACRASTIYGIAIYWR